MYLYAKAYPAENQGEFLPSGQKLKGYAEHKGFSLASRDAFPCALCPPKDEILFPFRGTICRTVRQIGFLSLPFRVKRGLTRGFLSGLLKGSKQIGKQPNQTGERKNG